MPKCTQLTAGSNCYQHRENFRRNWNQYGRSTLSDIFCSFFLTQNNANGRRGHANILKWFQFLYSFSGPHWGKIKFHHPSLTMRVHQTVGTIRASTCLSDRRATGISKKKAMMKYSPNVKVEQYTFQGFFIHHIRCFIIVNLSPCSHSFPLWTQCETKDIFCRHSWFIKRYCTKNQTQQRFMSNFTTLDTSACWKLYSLFLGLQQRHKKLERTCNKN